MKTKKYKVISMAIILCITILFYGNTTEAMEERAYISSEKSLSDIRRNFLVTFREKKEMLRYRDIGEGDWPLVDSVWMIYEKHYKEDPDSLSVPYCTYNAKGNFYAEVVDRGRSEIVLVYDGISENGKCYLFVAEEEKYDADGMKTDNTSLLEFYAVNLEEGEVYEAHKTSWGGAESEEYHKATTE